MKELTGFVLVKETNAGVPNLVVAAYDSETAARTSPSVERPQIMFDSLGKRIGSVLTNCEGRFVLTAEGLEFQGNESRPDLILAVFAPEDIQDPSSPYPLRPEQRLLYLSAVPLTDAGAKECFVIRLLQAQLSRFGIPATCTPSQGTSRSNRFAVVMQDTWAFRDGLRQALAPRIREELQKAATRKQAAQDKTKNLSAIPLYLRNSVLRNTKFLIKDRDDLKANLQRKQSDAISEGLTRLSSATPTLRLSLTAADMSDLGLKPDGSGKVDAAKLAQKVRSLLQDVDLVRVRGLNNPAPEVLERLYLSASAGTTTQDRGSGGVS